MGSISPPRMWWSISTPKISQKAKVESQKWIPKSTWILNQVQDDKVLRRTICLCQSSTSSTTSRLSPQKILCDLPDRTSGLLHSRNFRVATPQSFSDVGCYQDLLIVQLPKSPIHLASRFRRRLWRKKSFRYTRSMEYDAVSVWFSSQLSPQRVYPVRAFAKAGSIFEIQFRKHLSQQWWVSPCTSSRCFHNCVMRYSSSIFVCLKDTVGSSGWVQTIRCLKKTMNQSLSPLAGIFGSPDHWSD